MPKTKTSFFCQECGYESAKWVGKCPSCNSWNTMVEELVEKSTGNSASWDSGLPEVKKENRPVPLQSINTEVEMRISSHNNELNRVLGGGIVPGAVMLIGGEPGIGKSTLMLQLAVSLTHKKVLYVSGEESIKQIKMRADRLGAATESCYILPETSISSIFKNSKEVSPDLLIVDSIQTLYSDRVESAAGSISQVRQCAAELIRFAKETQTPVFLVGHITKDGAIAGPKVLEHMVDTVLQFEGDRHLTYRILRTIKNRFGSTAELGIYEMTHSGLREVSNPSEILITQRDSPVSGFSIGATLEGNRSLLIEVQALVSPAAYGTPQRTCTGFETKRLSMLLAVLEKRGGFRLGLQDVFLNMAGGIKVEDPAIDLAVCMAIISSLEEIPLPEKTCFAAEVGLSGELRAINKIENRLAEADKLGFESIYISKFNQKGLDQKKVSLQIKSFGKISDIITDLMG